MVSKLILIIICFSLIQPLYSQKRKYNYKKNEVAYFGFTVGPSFPYGDFGNTDGGNPRAGFAKTGYKAELFGGYNIAGSIGISIMGFMNINSVNLDNLNNELNSKYQGSSFSASSENWRTLGGFAGLSFSYPVDRRTMFDFRILSGYLKTEAPSLNFSSGSNENLITIKYEGTSANSLAYFVSAGLRYQLSEYFSLCFLTDYMGAYPKFDNVKITTSISGNTTSTNNSLSRSFQILDIAIGLRFSI